MKRFGLVGVLALTLGSSFPVFGLTNLNAQKLNRASVRPPDPIMTVDPTSLVLASGDDGTITWSVGVPAGVSVTTYAVATCDQGATWRSPEHTIYVRENPVTNVIWTWPHPGNCLPVLGSARTAQGAMLDVPLISNIWTVNLGTIEAGQTATVAITVRGK